MVLSFIATQIKALERKLGSIIICAVFSYTHAHIVLKEKISN